MVTIYIIEAYEGSRSSLVSSQGQGQQLLGMLDRFFTHSACTFTAL